MTKKGPAIGGAMALIQSVHKRGFPTLVPCKSKFFYKHCVVGKGTEFIGAGTNLAVARIQ